MKALALTDRNGMYGLIQFYKKATEAGIKPLLGAYIDEPESSFADRNSGAGSVDWEAYIDKFESEKKRKEEYQPGNGGEYQPGGRGVYEREYILLLAGTREGYSNLCRIITARKLKENFSLEEVLRGELRGLFVISPSIRLLKAAGNRGNVFGELPITSATKKTAREVYNFCLENRYKYLPTSPVFFLNEEDYLLHKIVTAIRLRKTLGTLREDETEPKAFYFREYGEMLREWKRVPGAVENLNFVIDNCNVDPEMGKTKFPVFPTPGGEPSFSYLWKLAFKGLEMRYHAITEKAINRLRYELEVI
ncbi:MAG: hypothetical protein B6D45_04770, partial [Ignavibacteriales bacterium UTCHB3]